MKQLNNTYKDYYYLCEDGTIYNSDTDTIIKPDKRHLFYLITADNKRKSVSLKPLYRELYNKEYCKDDIKDLKGEEWKEVAGSRGKYFVSNMGRIKSLQRYSAKILNPYSNQGGYLRVDIDIDSHRSSMLVHKLVASAFLSFPDRIDMQIHHIDFNLCNNAANNLEWLTATAHRKKHTERRNNLVSSEPKEDIH